MVQDKRFLFQNSIFVVSLSTPIIKDQIFQLTIGYINTSGQLTQILPSDVNLSYRILNNSQNSITDKGGLAFIPNQFGSFGIYFSYNDGVNILNTYFYFLVVKPVQRIGYNQLYTVLKQELPSSYNNNKNISSGNYLDNNATVKTLLYVYSVLYDIIDTQYPSNGYTTNWELALNNTNNLFKLGKYPTEALNLLYLVPYHTGITRYDLTLFLAKFCYYWIGIPTVVYIDNSYNIIIYADNTVVTWTLGDAILSDLGITTYLGDSGINLFGVLLTRFILRYFPVQIKWTLNFSGDDPLTVLTNVGYTYYSDLRPIKALKYFGDKSYPFNIEGYIVT